MTPLQLDWNKVFEFTWRILVVIVAIAIIMVVTTNWKAQRRPQLANARSDRQSALRAEMISDPGMRIGRPRQLYVGAARRDYPVGP